MRKECFKLSIYRKKSALLFFLGVFMWQISFAQIKISGTITSASDKTPLPGVNIVAKGTTSGVQSDINGKYSLDVKSGTTLEISFIGMRTKEVKVGDQAVIDVSLEEDVFGLDEVVVVGYGTMKKSDLTGSVASISPKELQSIPMISMEQSMGGRLAGVEVTQASHAPGGGITVRVRGGNSVNSSTEPLYVIDGIPVFSNNNQIMTNGPSDGVMPQMNLLAGINPGDIERIEVLKDGSSTAIYGARGANGVVLITTKRGSVGAPKIDYSAYYGFENIAHKIELLDAYQFAILHNEMNTNRGKPLEFTGTIRDGLYFGKPEEYISKYNPSGGTIPSTDWQDAVLRTGNMMNHQLNLSGGSTNTQYALSVNHLKHNGIVIGGDYTRKSIRMNLDSKITKWLSVGSSLNYSYSVSNNSGSETGMQWNNGGTISAALKAWPVFSPYDENGNLNVNAGVKTLRGNPVAYATLAKNRLNNNRALGNIFGTITFLEGLTLKVSLGIDMNSIARSRYFPRTTFTGSLDNGNAGKSNNSISSWLNENILTYEKNFGIHKINLMAGFTLQEETGEYFSTSSAQFPSDLFQDDFMSAGARQSDAAYSGRYKWSMASWLGRINYNLKDKYLLTLTGRTDGSSKFGSNNRWAFFPSVAVAWKASNEPFIENLNLFSNLKFRFSVGTTGNSEIGLYQSQPLLSIQNYTFGEEYLSPGVGPFRLMNPDLTWETTLQYDGGLEFGFMDDRLNLMIDGYYKKTSDLLLAANIPGTSGFNPPMLGFNLPPQNIGTLENKGVEFTLNYDVFKGPFQWKISGNISFNRNQILDLGGRNGFQLVAPNDLDKHGGKVWIDVGLPVGVWRRTIYDGVFKDLAEVEAYVNSEGNPIQPGAVPGDAKYLDVSGDGVFNGADLAIAGDPNPDFIFGVTNDFSYKNFTLSIFINGSQGSDINCPTFVHASDVTMGNGNLASWMWNRWTPENTDTDIPRMSADYNWTDKDKIFDGSYVRIKNVRLTYNVPASRVSFLSFLRSAQVYFNVSNLLTFTDYPGYDPEVNSTGQSSWQRGMDLNSFPATRGFMFGIQIGL